MSNNMLNIDDLTSLQNHLESQPFEVSQVIAVRCALRLFPLIQKDIERHRSRMAESERKQLIITAFRAAFVSWVSIRYPYSDWRQPTKLAADAVDEFLQVSTFATGAAAAAARSIAEPSHAAARATDAAYELPTLNEPFWLEIQTDLAAFGSDRPDTILEKTLWARGEIPTNLARSFESFRNELTALGPLWVVISDWVADFMHGLLPSSQPFEASRGRLLSLALQPVSFWQRNPDLVQLDIADCLGYYSDQNEKPNLHFETNKITRLQGEVDFFISYSNNDEAEAREINAYLEEAGFTTIAQFKDFPVGSNFVIEMQEGLQKGARAVVLLSPNYVTSDHCRAEWAAIYNMDPVGKQRKLISFLLHPTELNKLARQIVYRSLLGLRADERRHAVLDAIRYAPQAFTLDTLKARLSDTASPDVVRTSDGKMDVAPNATYDRAFYDMDLPDLPTTLRVLCEIIETSLPENCPKTIAPTFAAYRGHLEERGTAPILGLLKVLASAMNKEFGCADFEFWGAGLGVHFESFFASHSKLMSHFPLAEAREQTYAESEIYEEKASGRDFVAPILAVAEAIDELHGIGGTTPQFERVVRAQAQFAKDLDSLPPRFEDDAGIGTDITPKRRFVLMQVGFWERSLNVLGSLTTVASTPQGQTALNALRQAIGSFLSFVR